MVLTFAATQNKGFPATVFAATQKGFNLDPILYTGLVNFYFLLSEYNILCAYKFIVKANLWPCSGHSVVGRLVSKVDIECGQPQVWNSHLQPPHKFVNFVREFPMGVKCSLFYLKYRI